MASFDKENPKMSDLTIKSPNSASKDAVISGEVTDNVRVKEVHLYLNGKDTKIILKNDKETEYKKTDKSYFKGKAYQFTLKEEDYKTYITEGSKTVTVKITAKDYSSDFPKGSNNEAESMNKDTKYEFNVLEDVSDDTTENSVYTYYEQPEYTSATGLFRVGTARIATSPDSCGNISTRLTSLGIEHDVLTEEQYADYDILKDYDLLLISCIHSNYSKPSLTAAAFQQYVRNGGIIFAEYWSDVYIKTAFPGTPNNKWTNYGNGKVKYTTQNQGNQANILNAIAQVKNINSEPKAILNSEIDFNSEEETEASIETKDTEKTQTTTENEEIETSFETETNTGTEQNIESQTNMENEETKTEDNGKHINEPIQITPKHEIPQAFSMENSLSVKGSLKPQETSLTYSYNTTAGNDFDLNNNDLLGDFSITLIDPNGNTYNSDNYGLKYSESAPDMVILSKGGLGFQVINPVQGEWKYFVTSKSIDSEFDFEITTNEKPQASKITDNISAFASGEGVSISAVSPTNGTVMASLYSSEETIYNTEINVCENGQFTINLPTLADGYYKLKLTSRDLNGKIGNTLVQEIEINTADPQISINSDFEKIIHTGTTDFAFYADNAENLIITLNAAEQEYTAEGTEDGNLIAASLNLTEGANTISITAVTSAGKTTNRTFTVYSDTITPDSAKTEPIITQIAAGENNIESIFNLSVPTEFIVDVENGDYDNTELLAFSDKNINTTYIGGGKWSLTLDPKDFYNGVNFIYLEAINKWGNRNYSQLQVNVSGGKEPILEINVPSDETISVGGTISIDLNDVFKKSKDITSFEIVPSYGQISRNTWTFNPNQVGEYGVFFNVIYTDSKGEAYNTDIDFKVIAVASEDGNITSITNGQSFAVKYDILSGWGNSQSIEVTLFNTSDEVLRNWSLKYLSSGQISGIWGAAIHGQNGNSYVVKNNTYNKDIQPNDSVTFGYTLVGGNQTVPAIQLATNKIDVTDGVSVTLNTKKGSGDYLSGNITIINNTGRKINAWELSLTKNFNIKSLWNSQIIKNDTGELIVSGENSTTGIPAGGSIVIGIDGTYTETPTIEDIEVKEFVFE